MSLDALVSDLKLRVDERNKKALKNKKEAEESNKRKEDVYNTLLDKVSDTLEKFNFKLKDLGLNLYCSSTAKSRSMVSVQLGGLLFNTKWDKNVKETLILSINSRRWEVEVWSLNDTFSYHKNNSLYMFDSSTLKDIDFDDLLEEFIRSEMGRYDKLGREYFIE